MAQYKTTHWDNETRTSTIIWVPCDVLEEVGTSSLRIKLAGGQKKTVRAKNVKRGVNAPPDNRTAQKAKKEPSRDWTTRYDNY